MTADGPIKVFDSSSADYQRAFQVFLDHTDQKAKAKEWLDHRVQALPARRVFIDVGAGNGKVTAWFLDRFQQTIAIEPNPHLCEELRRHCPAADVRPSRILDATCGSLGDFVLCSHVLYYIPRAEWLAHLEQMASWVGPGGMLVVMVQNHQTDCMRMLEHFVGQRFNLSELAKEFRAASGRRYDVAIETVPAHVETADLASACTVAEFMLNLLPISQPPAKKSVEDYVRRQFADGAGRFRFSCHQDCLTIRPKI